MGGQTGDGVQDMLSPNMAPWQIEYFKLCCCSVTKSATLWTAALLCSSQSSGVCSDSCPLSQ